MIPGEKDALAKRGPATDCACGRVVEGTDATTMSMGPRAAESASRTPLVAYFGPDIDDPAVRRRVAQWRYAGFAVLPFAFSRRTKTGRAPAEFVNLGRIRQSSRLGRLIPLMIATCRVLARWRTLREIDLFIGRNLDNLVLALLAQRIVLPSAPVVYEVLDINRLCTAPGIWGGLLRRLEAWVLARIDLLIVSSSQFVTYYYEAGLHYRGSYFVFENKIPRGGPVSLSPRPSAIELLRAPYKLSATGTRIWRIGWFGYLDDEKSWETLRCLAQTLSHKVAIYVRGMPYTGFDMARFLADVKQLDNVRYGGLYNNPQDLRDIYNAIDIVWSADFNLPQGNSKWLLTNSLYEAAYFGKPVIGLAGTAVGEFLASYGTGWCIDDPVDRHLIDFFENLTDEHYRAKQGLIAALPADRFLETNEIERVWTSLQERARRSLPAYPANQPVVTGDDWSSR